MQRKMKLGIVGTLMAVMVASVAYAWVASNTLTFTTTLSGSPFLLVSTPTQLPTTMYYEEPFVLQTTTDNLATKAYDGVKTNYKIWRDDGGDIEDPADNWITVNIVDAYHPAPGMNLTFTLAPGAKSITAFIGPYTASAGFHADATVTVTLHAGAATVKYDAQVWVSVG